MKAERKQLKRWYVCIILGIIVSLFLILKLEHTKIDESKIVVELYYLNPCESCDEDEEFKQAIWKELDEQKIDVPFSMKTYNVFQDDARKHMEEVSQRYGLEINIANVPAALIEGQLYTGIYQKIGEQLATYFVEGLPVDPKFIEKDIVVEETVKNIQITAEEQRVAETLFEKFAVEEYDANVFFFYREDCQECKEIQPFIEKIPPKIKVNGKEVELNLICLNSREGNNGERIRALFNIYDVPSEKQMVPFVFLADRYLAGKKEIEENLLELLEQGHGNMR